MILKIGYMGKDGIENYRYFDEFSDVIVADIQAGYEYDTKNDKLTLDKKKLDQPEFVMFNSYGQESPTVRIVYIMYYTETGAMTTIAALGGTVYIMNDNGKTVDRY